MTIGEWLTDAARGLSDATISSNKLDSELILGHVLGRDRAWIKAHSNDELTSGHIKVADGLIRRRADHEPLVHLTGSREFFGLDMIITPDVLTPRMETEQLVEWAITYAPTSTRLIDIGTGSGAIAIAIAQHRPDLAIAGTDVSVAALKIAKLNAKKHGVEIDLVYSDLWDDVEGTFQTIVTNLPYLRDGADLMPEVRREPGVALFGGPDGLGLYRRFLNGLSSHLAPGGYLFTECDPWQQADLMAETAKLGLKPIEQGYFILGFQQSGH